MAVRKRNRRNVEIIRYETRQENQDKTRQENQSKTREDKTGQDRTGQDRTRSVEKARGEDSIHRV